MDSLDESVLGIALRHAQAVIMSMAVVSLDAFQVGGDIIVMKVTTHRVMICFCIILYIIFGYTILTKCFLYVFIYTNWHLYEWQSTLFYQMHYILEYLWIYLVCFKNKWINLNLRSVKRSRIRQWKGYKTFFFTFSY